jgi:anti-anti-sigma regulatory factor
VDSPRSRTGTPLIEHARALRGAACALRQRAAGARADSGALGGHPAGTRPDGTAEARVVAQTGEYVLVEVSGAVDIGSCGAVSDVLSRAVGSGAPVLVVDLTQVTLLAAAGYNSLRPAADLLAERAGHLLLTCPPGGPATRVMGILDPGGTWPVHADVATAVATIGEQP